MLRNNREIQALADKCAQENGFFCASYLGRKGDVFIYEPCQKSDEEIYCFSEPLVIIVENDKAEFVECERWDEFLNRLKFRDYKKGRSIFKEYERKVDEDDFASNKEREYISEIVYNQRPSYDVPVPKTELYKYLEIADRLNMKIEIKPYERCRDRNDGWCYYIELINDIMIESQRQDN